MNLKIKSTEKMVLVDGVECRQWDGITDDGETCAVFVYVIELRTASRSKSKFLHELKEVQPPREIKEVLP